MTTPSVSVVMTCFNHQRYVRDAIASVISQSHSNWELIVVDDGSNDDSVARARLTEDPRVNIVCKENGGPSDAANSGIAKARGEFVILASADDLFEQDLIDEQLAAIKAAGADVGFCLPTLIDHNNRELSDNMRRVFFKTRFQFQEELYCKLFIQGNFLLAPGAIIRRSLFSQHGLFSHGLYHLQDFELWIRLVPHCKIIHLPRRLVRYRLLPDESSLSARPDPYYISAEYRLIYEHFFDCAPRSFVKDAFGHMLQFIDSDDPNDREVEIALLLMINRRAEIQRLGLEKAIWLMNSPAVREIFQRRFKINPGDLRRIANNMSGPGALDYKFWTSYNVNTPSAPRQHKKGFLGGLRKQFNLTRYERD